jgi:SAM-dependent methyltransferase
MAVTTVRVPSSVCLERPFMPARPDFDMARAWDRASAVYLARRDAACTTVTYGALAPSEAELHLLGDLRGRRVLDLGCGGGHNAVACARAGASVTGLDVSAAQLAHARNLASRHGVPVTWLQAGAADAGHLLAPGWDLILAIHSLPYVQDLAAALAACRLLLAPSGRLVISLDHPIRDCFLDEEEGDLSGFPVRDYFDRSPVAWRFAADLPMQAAHLPVSDWYQSLHEANLGVIEMLEPPVPPDLRDGLWPLDSPLAPLRTLPHTLILVATPSRA